MKHTPFLFKLTIYLMTASLALFIAGCGGGGGASVSENVSIDQGRGTVEGGGSGSTDGGAVDGGNENTGGGAVDGDSDNTGGGAVDGGNENTGGGAVDGGNESTGGGAVEGETNQNNETEPPVTKSDPTVDTSPPVISQAKANFDVDTNSAVLSVVAADIGSGILSVRAVVTTPSGEVLTFNMAYDAASGTYTTLYQNIPKNWTFAPVEYTVNFTALDKAENQTTKQIVFYVDGLEAPPAPI